MSMLDNLSLTEVSGCEKNLVSMNEMHRWNFSSLHTLVDSTTLAAVVFRHNKAVPRHEPKRYSNLCSRGEKSRSVLDPDLRSSEVR